MFKTSLLISSLLVLTVLGSSITLDELKPLWSSWKIYYGRDYSAAEEHARFAIFAENYKKIVQLNSEDNSFKSALNKFADLTSEEFKNIYASGFLYDEKTVRQNEEKSNIHVDYSLLGLPSSVDWRQKGAVNPPKDQGQCGSCWTFSATGALEALYFITKGELLSFSEQQIVDCDGEDAGCDGGIPADAFDYTAQYGIETEADYPYDGSDNTCKYDASKAYHVNTGKSAVTPQNVDAMKAAIAGQPVSVAIEADQNVFQFYASGVISSKCGDSLDHAVLIVGYVAVDNIEAFIVKNSWGASWGDSGYVYISTDGKANKGNGVCGILAAGEIPTA